MFVFVLPEIGEGVVEGEIVRWLVKPGDNIAKDQPLCEIMTDKATVEISTPRGGRIAALHGREGDIVKVHAPLADIDESGAASVAAPAPTPAPTPAPAAPRPAPVAAPAPAAAPAPVAAPAPAPVARPPGAKTLATPAVRSHARQVGVEIDQVPGSGKAGRVTHADIEAFTSVAEPVAPPALPQVETPAGGEDRRVRIIGLRRKISEKMVEAWTRVPHFTYVDEVDATRLVALREGLRARAEAQGVKLNYIPFIMKALSVVFREFPNVNAVMDEAAGELVVRGDVNIGIATDTEAGLFVPVIKQVQRKSILELAREIAELTARVRAGKAALHELQGGSFTITSVGNIGGRFATPIINVPEVAILGVNQIHDRAVVVDGQIVARKMFYLSPSFDHRVIDGAVAARFVTALKAVLEQPESLILELR